MNMKTRFLTGVLALAGMLAISSEVSAGAVTTKSIERFSVDNPCTAANISGGINVQSVFQESNGVVFFKANFKGSSADTNGLNYQIHANFSFQQHDPLPSIEHQKLQFISQTDVDNFEVDTAIHINEQGKITKLDFGGSECKG